MARVPAIGLFAASLLLRSIAVAEEPTSDAAPAAYVRVDWSRVSNDVIHECALEGFGSLILQHLIEEGYVPVEQSGPAVIDAEITASEKSFSIVSSVGVARRSARVSIPKECDSSIQFDVIHALLQTLEPIRGDAVQARIALAALPVEEPVVVRKHRDRMWFDFYINAKWVGQSRPLIMIDAESSFAIGQSPVLLGVGLENSFMKYGGRLWVTEPAVYGFADFRVNKNYAPAFYIGLEAAALLHIYRGPVSGQHGDARFGARFRLGLEKKPHFGILLRVFGRLFSFKHVDGTETLYDSDHWGISVGGFFGFGR